MLDNNPKSKLAVLLLLIFLPYLSHAEAPSCSNILSMNQNPLEVAKYNLKKAKNLDEANRLTYELVNLGNIFLDTVVDEIIAINQEANENPEKLMRVRVIVEALQKTFEIPDFVMSSVIENRIEIEEKELKDQLKAENRRRAIGFLTDESVEDFHASDTPQKSVGFRLKKSEDDFVAWSLPYLIENPNAFGMDEEAKEESLGKKRRIGFKLPLKDSESSEETSNEKIQPGFIDFSSSDEPFDENDIFQVILNVRLGQFKVIKASPQIN